MASRQLVSAWGLVAALVIAVLAACADEGGSHDGRWGQGVYVPEAWSTARAVNGHRLHVVKRKIECTKCHSLKDNEMGPVTPDRCAACHEKQAEIEHASQSAERQFGFGTKADCTSCHAFTLEGTGHEESLRDGGPARVRMDGGAGAFAFGIPAYTPTDCKRCHQEAQGNVPAVLVHGTQPCLTCHKPHESKVPQSAPCADCHQEIATTHASKGKTPVETCATCHQHRHGPAKDAIATCAGCHANQKPIVPSTALFESGHTQCISCHRPHEFESKTAAPCRTCHEDLNVLGGSRVPAHNACTSCHSPHAVKASPAAACANCHKNVHSDHPKQGQVGACVSCHDPHPNRVLATVDARACSSCHSFAHTDNSSHGKVACTGCHKPHHFALSLSLASRSTCEGCHSERVRQVATNQGHQACQNCHRGLPHRPEALKIGCETCHSAEHAKANAGHARCTQCHEPHSGAQSAPCATCHKAEHQTAPAGHQECTKCHEPHVGSPAQKTCGECHAAERKSPHGELKTGCLTCHRPHGPSGVASVPACASCHEVAKLPGLHKEAKHQACERCHSGHEAKGRAERQACLNCHNDRKDHYPDAPRCASCHLFTQAH